MLRNAYGFYPKPDTIAYILWIAKGSEEITNQEAMWRALGLTLAKADTLLTQSLGLDLPVTCTVAESQDWPQIGGAYARWSQLPLAVSTEGNFDHRVSRRELDWSSSLKTMMIAIAKSFQWTDFRRRWVEESMLPSIGDDGAQKISSWYHDRSDRIERKHREREREF